MTGVPDEDSPATNAIAGAVTLLTLAAAFGLLAVGWPYFWIAFPIGFGGLLPTALALARWYGESEGGEPATSEAEDPLENLRERYARGEIDDREFERRVERLLETESRDVAEATYGTDGAAPDGPTSAVREGDGERAIDRERDRSIQRDRDTERS